MDELDELLNIADRIRWTDDCHRRFQELSQAQSRNVRDCDFTEADSRRLCASEHGSAGGCDLFSDNADSDDDSCLSGVVLKERYNASELLGLAKCSGFQDFATIEHTVTDGNCGYDAIRIGCSDHDLNFPESFARFREDLFILTKKLIENGVVEKSIVMPGKRRANLFCALGPIDLTALIRLRKGESHMRTSKGGKSLTVRRSVSPN